MIKIFLLENIYNLALYLTLKFINSKDQKQ
jgi:hypothetical protein